MRQRLAILLGKPSEKAAGFYSIFEAEWGLIFIIVHLSCHEGLSSHALRTDVSNHHDSGGCLTIISQPVDTGVTFKRYDIPNRRMINRQIHRGSNRDVLNREQDSTIVADAIGLRQYASRCIASRSQALKGLDRSIRDAFFALTNYF